MEEKPVHDRIVESSLSPVGDLATKNVDVWAYESNKEHTAEANLPAPDANAKSYDAGQDQYHPRYSPDFANTPLKAFTDNEAKQQRGCANVRMTAEP
ncbi:hypothetical protein [Streptomyces sp. NPDC001415]